MKILQLTVHFSPNIGGVETHLDNLCESLVKRGFEVTVLTYRPLHTKTTWKMLEDREGTQIIRIPWLPDLFYKLVNKPFWEFVYLIPGLFLLTPLIILLKRPKIIHAHGLVAGFAGVFWGKVFGKKVVISLHNIYHFPKKGMYRNFTLWIFSNTNAVLGLSRQSVDEVKSLGVPSDKVDKFTYWIDLENFRRIANAKKQLGWKSNFVVSFVGRLVPEKGVEVLLKAAEIWNKNIMLVVIGAGPLENKVLSAAGKSRNIKYIGSIDQNKLPLYYSGSDILVMPSVSEEGFGRVMLESLACGTPIIGANRGGIIEAIDESVGRLINVGADSLKSAAEDLYKNRNKLNNLANNCRRFAERRFSEKNVQSIIKSYQT